MSDAVTHTNGNGAAHADTPEYRDRLLGGPLKLSLLIGIGGLIAYLVLAGLVYTMSPTGNDEEKHTAFRAVTLPYLTGFTFWMIIGFGGLFFLLVQYVTGGRWGILLRRPLEANAKNIYTLGFFLFVPVAVMMFLGKDSVYWWAQHHAEHMQGEHDKGESPGVGKQTQAEPANKTVRNDVVRPNVHADLEKKIADYLFPSYTAFRGFLYIAVFSGLVLWMWGNARRAEYDPDLAAAAAARDRQKYVGSFGLFVFAIFMTFIATDWVMSLEETFASSMFPVIMFDNAAVASYCIGLLTLLWLKRKGDPRFQHLFPPTEQIHLGSLLLAFTLAWTYFNFSQYMLIWIGNLPEEIPFFMKRSNETGWWWVSAGLIVFHFACPFLLLLFRDIKLHPVRLRWMAIYLLVVCAVDVVWWVEPSFEHASPLFVLMDAGAVVGIGGVWGLAFISHLKRRPLLPTNETYMLPEGHHHEHH
jgi:hypothetical protein